MNRFKKFIYIDNACTINYNNKNYKNEQYINSYKPWIWQGVSTEGLKSSTMSGINIRIDYTNVLI